MSINPDKDKASLLQKAGTIKTDSKNFPRFILDAKFDTFRHISGLSLEFKHPVTVISGSNKSGKTTVLFAIACSHQDVKKEMYINSKSGAKPSESYYTWQDFVKFSRHDTNVNWSYKLFVKNGAKQAGNSSELGMWQTVTRIKKAKRWRWTYAGAETGKLTGVEVVFLDLNRLLPARYRPAKLYNQSRNAPATAIFAEEEKNEIIAKYLSYIFEQAYTVTGLASYQRSPTLGFNDSANLYSSYNSASGEDALSSILIACVAAKKNSLILIDEIELGLHPKVQRRLMEVLIHISNKEQKQFIITSHSPTVMDCVPDYARIFIETRPNQPSTSICPISINAALTKMDSANYPLIDVFCEDVMAEWIIGQVLQILENRKKPDSEDYFSLKLINIIASCGAGQAYQNFKARQRIFDKVKIRSGHACVLDGDMKTKKKKASNEAMYPLEDDLFFLLTEAPEKALCRAYEQLHPDPTLKHNIATSPPHCLFQKMVDHCVNPTFMNTEAARDACWAVLKGTKEGEKLIDELGAFLKNVCKRAAPGQQVCKTDPA